MTNFGLMSIFWNMANLRKKWQISGKWQILANFGENGKFWVYHIPYLTNLRIIANFRNTKIIQNFDKKFFDLFMRDSNER